MNEQVVTGLDGIGECGRGYPFKDLDNDADIRFGVQEDLL